jgi:hypothetical protein
MQIVDPCTFVLRACVAADSGMRDLSWVRAPETKLAASKWFGRVPREVDMMCSCGGNPDRYRLGCQKGLYMPTEEIYVTWM